MKLLHYFLTAAVSFPSFLQAEIDPERVANTIILTQQAVENLKIELAEATERTFEESVFAIGRIEAIPRRRSVVSSRIPGRVVELNAFVGDRVEKGDVLVRVQSRQPGDPPPVIPLTAPRTGLVIESHISDGDTVEPNSELLDIVDLSTVWAVAKVPESEAAKIKTGTRAYVRIPALGPERLDGVFLRFGVQADRSASAIDAIFEIPNQEDRIRPGMRAEFSIVTDRQENVLSVPRTAVQGNPLNRVVFVRDFELENTFLKSPVVLGAQNDRYFEVKSGLFPGDEVVTRGSYQLGFAGDGGGPSLKETLDAAHGHEHAEDGSELTAEQKAAEEVHGHDGEGAHEEGGPVNRLLLIWAAAATILLLVSVQQNLRSKKKSPAGSQNA